MPAITSIEIRYEQDVVSARQRARQIAAFLGFDPQQQTRLATAVSEIARNAYQYAGGGRVEFTVEGDTQPQTLLVSVSDRGPGIRNLSQILDGAYVSRTGMGVGIVGARRLMDQFEIQSRAAAGTVVSMRKLLPRKAPLLTVERLTELTAELIRKGSPSVMDELRQQNQDMVRTLDELLQRQDELTRLNRELEDTNRGVVALYAELDERADHLRRADEVKTRFLSNMTHEFRTPLNSILALSRLLIDRVDGDLSIEQERQVFFIRKAAENLSELVNDLLDLAKVEAGKIVIRPAEFDVGSLFGALRGMLRPLLLNTSVNLVFEDLNEVLTLCTDEGKVSQILRNFISNALKFTEHGEVRVSATITADRRSVIFAVGDTGIGIAPEHQQIIFQEFAQLDNSMQRKVRGTGLGLPLSKKLAELLGGSVSVSSEPGIGSTFYVTIPVVYTGAQSDQDVMLTPNQPDHSTLPVLVVEDEIESRMLYEKYLRGSSFQPMAARSVREARSSLEMTRPAAIILDIVLQGEETWGLLAELKTSPETRAIPVLVITNVEERQRALSLGADGFANKPVARRWLIEELHNCTRLKSPRKILLIDDEEVSRYLLRQMFPPQAGRVLEAAGGVDGLRCAREELPDLIFLDLLMPELSGLDLLAQLRADPNTASIPVVISTSKTLTGEERERLEQLEAKYLPKSSLADGSAFETLRQILGELGLGDILEEAAAGAPNTKSA